MAHETGEPKNLLILGIGVGSIVTLVAVLYALQSYYYGLRDAEQHEKVLGRPNADLVKLRADEQRQLTSYAKLDPGGKRVRIPINQAMGLLVQRGRDGFPSIRPEAAPAAGSAPAAAGSAPAPATSAAPPGSASAPGNRPGAPPNRPQAPPGGHLRPSGVMNGHAGRPDRVALRGGWARPARRPTLAAMPRALARLALCLLALAAPLALGPRAARAEDFVPAPPPVDEVPAQLRDVGVTEHLGELVPRDVRLRDEAGREVRLGDFVAGRKPLLLQFVYHSCPTLCSLVSSGLVASLRELPLTVGEQFEVLTVSIDPHDTPAIAAEKKQKALAAYGRGGEGAAAAWHFLTGEASEVKRLADAVGFAYRYEAEEKQFAHSAALFVLSPDGKLSRYLYGIEFPAFDVRLALAEAAEGRTVTSTVDHLLLYCYRYDPLARSYVFFAINLMRVGGALSVALLAFWLVRLWRREMMGPEGFGRPPARPAAPSPPTLPSPRG
jgi:protein SCO1